MIFVTSGHEKGIGLEIFLKSYLLLSHGQQKEIILFISRPVLQKNIRDLGLNLNSFLNLQIIEDEIFSSFHSTNSLRTALLYISDGDVLITLPTSKDQLIYNQKQCAGYTEFFRSYFNNKNIAMTFKAYNQDVLLITDHLPLKKVANSIRPELISNKVSLVIDSYKKYFYSFSEVLFSGINPHAGEGGILGNEEKKILIAIRKLSKKSKIKFHGPFSGDVLNSYANEKAHQLMVYMFHDQGLASFKTKNGLTGLNITHGLPFLRLSVDHGTAFDLYGKNNANISSMLYLFKLAFEVHKNVNQRN